MKILEYISDEYIKTNSYLLELREEILSNYQPKEIHIKYPEPSDIRISTMTIISDLNSILNIEDLFDIIDLEEENKNNVYPRIDFMKYGGDKIKGNTKINKKKKNKKNYFQNQMTVCILLDEIKKINMKLFKNGKIQLTGIKDINIINDGCNYIFELIKKKNMNHTIIDNIETFKYINNQYQIVLINSDFKVNYLLNRENIFKLLNTLNFFVIYEPDIYPGVNLKYFINSNNKVKGICNCTEKCNGKGNCNGDGDCKRITIAIFQSGSIIITGSKHDDQVQECFKFINNLLRENFSEIIDS
jgi:TATA-box binding protein (TBP) (component of TFIID and TFIIIB)